MHNHTGTAVVGAEIVTAVLCQQLGIKGDIHVIGCPAEEILWGKFALLAVFSRIERNILK